MTNLPQKYYVFKKKKGEYPSNLTSPPLPQGEYFVIRRQDILASQTLWSYIRSLKFLLKFGKDGLTGYQIKNLEGWLEGLVEMAHDWDQAFTKVPD